MAVRLSDGLRVLEPTRNVEEEEGLELAALIAEAELELELGFDALKVEPEPEPADPDPDPEEESACFRSRRRLSRAARSASAIQFAILQRSIRLRLLEAKGQSRRVQRRLSHHGLREASR